MCAEHQEIHENASGAVPYKKTTPLPASIPQRDHPLHQQRAHTSSATMIIIALTGALATGKSTVSHLLSQPPYNLPIIDADLLAREVVLPDTRGYHQILQHFAPSTPDLLVPPPPNPDGQDEARWASVARAEDDIQKRKMAGRPIDRAVLGRRVFGEGKERDRKVLNGIVHPAVRLAMLKAVLYYHFLGHWAVVLDVPLLYESALDVFASVVVMVAVSDPEVQMRRLGERDTALSVEEARDRVGSQMGVEEKVERTKARGKSRGKVLLNDHGKEELWGEVGRVMREIERESGSELWRWWLWGSPVGVAGAGIWEMYQGWRARRGWEAEKSKL